MKILFFSRSLGVGGSERQMALLAVGLARRGHDVAIAALHGGGALEYMLQDSQVRLVRLGKTLRWHVLGPLWRLWRLFMRERPDVVYAFLPAQTALAALLLSPWLPARLVFGLRATDMDLGQYDMLSGFFYWLERRLAWRADLIIANGAAVRAHAAANGMPEQRIAVVSNGIDTAALRPDLAGRTALRRAWDVGNGHFLIGMVARLDPMKDHGTFIGAASRFARTEPDARFVCVGDGSEPDRRRLRELAEAEGISERLIWVGTRGDLGAVYSALDIATLSSAFGEGFPNVIGEAMACGVSVVATDVGETRAVIGECGEVVPPRRPDLLAEGWARWRRRLAADPKGLSAAARARIAERFSVETMVTRTERALAALCAGEPAEQIVRELA